MSDAKFSGISIFVSTLILSTVMIFTKPSCSEIRYRDEIKQYKVIIFELKVLLLVERLNLEEERLKNKRVDK